VTELSLYNIKGEEVGEFSLKEDIFNAKINKYIVHQIVSRYLADKRRGTASTKTRGKVSGGGAKPWRQKGTGRARAGSNRSPIWVGGGTVFGPQPRDYSFSLPRKMRIAAIKSILSDKVKNKEVIILDQLILEDNKTKKMVKILKNLNALEKPLIIIDQKDQDIEKVVRNIDGAMVLPASQINSYDLLNHRKLIFTKEAIQKIEEVLNDEF